jgi:hypothetical protein
MIERDFDALLKSFHENKALLRQVSQQAAISFMGRDLFGMFGVTQAAMERIAANLKRSANVGIGFAFAAHHIRD